MHQEKTGIRIPMLKMKSFTNINVLFSLVENFAEHLQLVVLTADDYDFDEYLASKDTERNNMKVNQ